MMLETREDVLKFFVQYFSRHPTATMRHFRQKLSSHVQMGTNTKKLAENIRKQLQRYKIMTSKKRHNAQGWFEYEKFFDFNKLEQEFGITKKEIYDK